MTTDPTSNQANRLVVTSEDLQTSAVEARVEQMKEAQKVALVRDIGAPTTNSRGIGRAVVSMLGAGLVGGLVAFGLQRFLFNVVGLFKDAETATGSNVLFTFLLAFGIGVFVALADPLFSQDFRKTGRIAMVAVPVALGVGLVIGFIANWYYTSATESLVSKVIERATTYGWGEEQAFAYYTSQLHPLRGIAWMLVGIASGLAAGIPSGSGKRVGLGAAGGAVGGFLGGFLFDYISGETAAQAAGILLLGALIGLAVALLEQAAKSRWIEILAGGMAGKQFILYKADVTLGSAPTADVTLIKDPAIAPAAARLSVRGSVVTLEALDPACPVYVNGQLASRQTLQDSSRISIGNTEIRFRERSNQGAAPGAIRR